MRYGSAKINSEIIEKMFKENNITSNEISVLLWLALYQDEYGRTFNVKYKDVCKDMEISYQGYYNCTKRLARNGYIRIISESYTSGWDIEIINNVFASEEDDKKRYLNVNRDIFFEKNFLDLKANEKKIMMKMVLLYIPKFDYYINILEIGKWLGINNIQLLRSYIEKIKIFFKIGLKQKYNKDKRVIIFQRGNMDITESYQNQSIFYHYTKLKLKSMLRKFKVQYTNQEMDDLITLVNQYKEYSGLLNQTIIETVFEKRSVEPKLINYKIKTELKKLNPQAWN